MTTETGFETEKPRGMHAPPSVDRTAEAAREQAHLDWRVRCGTMAYGVWEGSGTVTAYRDGRNIDIDVVAQEPVPINTIVRHGDFKEGEPIEMVTPLARPT